MVAQGCTTALAVLTSVNETFTNVSHFFQSSEDISPQTNLSPFLGTLPDAVLVMPPISYTHVQEAANDGYKAVSKLPNIFFKSYTSAIYV